MALAVKFLTGIKRDARDHLVARAASSYYEGLAPGSKYKLTDIVAAIGMN